MADFKAQSRLPSRPLSYEYIDQAVNKELIIDYTNGEIYVKDDKGIVHSITSKVFEALRDEILKDPTIITEVIVIPIIDPDTLEEKFVSIDKAILILFDYIKKVEDALNAYIESNDNRLEGIETDIENLDKIINDPDTGLVGKVEDIENVLGDLSDPDGILGRIDKLEKDNIAFGTIIEIDENGTANLPAGNITTDAEHQFVTEEQLNNIETISQKCEVKYKIVTIRASDWQGTEAPYTVALNIPEITSDMRPMLDLICSAYYETSEKEEEAFCIYKGITSDGVVTLYNRVRPEIDLTVQFEIKYPSTII